MKLVIRIVNELKKIGLTLLGLLITSPAFAALPTASKDLDVSNGWIPGLTGFAKIAVPLVLGVLSLLLFAKGLHGMMMAFGEARVKQDLSHFVTWCFAGIVLIILGCVCVYAAYQIFNG